MRWAPDIGPKMFDVAKSALIAFTLNGIWMVFTFVGAVMSVTLFGAAYSWWVWRHASDRNEGADYVV